MEFVRHELPNGMAAVMFREDMVVVDSRLSDGEARAAAELIVERCCGAFTKLSTDDLGVDGLATSQQRETR